jgi:glycosyltransferase involved in cell wall biosynthesis
VKVLFLHRNLPPESHTGVAVQVHRLGNALCDLGHEVSVYTHSPAPLDARYRVLPIRLAGLPLALRLLPGLKRLWYPLWYRNLDMTGYDAVHVHGDGGFLRYRPNYVRTFYGTAALERRFARGPKGRLAQGLSYRLEKREAARCRHRVGISPHIADHLTVDAVIPCMLPDDPDPAPAVKTAHPSLVFLGSRFSRKRGELALALFLELRKSFPGLTLAYLGPAGETAALRGNPEYAGVEFLSGLSQDAMDALFRRSWAYLCLSSYEGFGVGIIEAMAHSCLVITTPHAGSDFLVRDGETGLVTRVEDAAATAVRALSDADLRAALTERARAGAARYAPAAVASAYADLYRRAAASQGMN